MQKNKIIIYINKENSVVSDTRNTGIKKSTSKYITFIDIDNTIELNTVKKLLNILKNIRQM